MVMEFLIVLTLVALVVSSITDIKTREVPDWLSFALIFAGLGIRLIQSLYSTDWTFFLEGLVGFAVLFGLSAFLFYTGQWGGGDSKLLMGMGATMGLPFHSSVVGHDIALVVVAVVTFVIIFILNLLEQAVESKKYLNFIISILSAIFMASAACFITYSTFIPFFILLLLMVGGIYGFLWSLALALLRWNAFKEEYTNSAPKGVIRMTGIGVILLSGVIIILYWPSPLYLLAALPLTVYIMLLLIFSIRAVENVCMQKEIPPKQLTEGDWIAEPVMHKGKLICGPDDLGVSKQQIQELMKLKVKKVRIKEGIPFVPSFFIAFLLGLLI